MRLCVADTQKGKEVTQSRKYCLDMGDRYDSNTCC